MTTLDLITRAEFIYKKCAPLFFRRAACATCCVPRAEAHCAMLLPPRPPCRSRSARACVLAHRYEKYTKDENKERLLNPGDAFSEAVLDFQTSIAALMEARALTFKSRPRNTATHAWRCCVHCLRAGVPTRCCVAA